MNEADLKERKLNIIEQLIILNDDKVFKQVEDLINATLNRPHLEKLTKSDLKKRAQLSNDDILNGDTYNQEEAEKMSLNW